MKVKLSVYGLLLALTLTPTPAWSVTANDIISAIDKGKILAPSIRVNAQVRPDVVYISTYKNLKANDRDCKIEAVLLAKTVMDLAPEIPRVEVRFYEQTSLNRFKQISISAGDVKAFASGSIKEDQLLNGLVLKQEETTDPNAKLTTHLEESQYLRAKQEVSSMIEGKKALVFSGLDPTLDDIFIKAEALRLAQKTFEAVGPEVEEVQVTFVDPGKDGQDRLVSLKRPQEKQISEGFALALKDIVIDSKAKAQEELTLANLESYEIKDGRLKEQRQAILNKLKSLSQSGVNVGRQILARFVEIEAGVEAMEESALRTKISDLSDVMDKLEENYKNAKAIKATATQPAVNTTVKPATAGSAPLPTQSAAVDKIKARILANPQSYISETVASLQRRSPTGNGEDHPNFPKLMQFAIQTLKEKGRSQEASALEAKLQAIQARNAH
jgi:hypothetical protein